MEQTGYRYCDRGWNVMHVGCCGGGLVAPAAGVLALAGGICLTVALVKLRNLPAGQVISGQHMNVRRLFISGGALMGLSALTLALTTGCCVTGIGGIGCMGASLICIFGSDSKER